MALALHTAKLAAAIYMDPEAYHAALYYGASRQLGALKALLEAPTPLNEMQRNALAGLLQGSGPLLGTLAQPVAYLRSLQAARWRDLAAELAEASQAGAGAALQAAAAPEYTWTCYDGAGEITGMARDSRVTGVLSEPFAIAGEENETLPLALSGESAPVTVPPAQYADLRGGAAAPNDGTLTLSRQGPAERNLEDFPKDTSMASRALSASWQLIRLGAVAGDDLLLYDVGSHAPFPTLSVDDVAGVYIDADDDVYGPFMLLGAAPDALLLSDPGVHGVLPASGTANTTINLITDPRLLVVHSYKDGDDTVWSPEFGDDDLVHEGSIREDDTLSDELSAEDFAALIEDLTSDLEVAFSTGAVALRTNGSGEDQVIGLAADAALEVRSPIRNSPTDVQGWGFGSADNPADEMEIRVDDAEHLVQFLYDSGTVQGFSAPDTITLDAAGKASDIDDYFVDWAIKLYDDEELIATAIIDTHDGGTRQVVLVSELSEAEYPTPSETTYEVVGRVVTQPLEYFAERLDNISGMTAEVEAVPSAGFDRMHLRSDTQGQWGEIEILRGNILGLSDPMEALGRDTALADVASPGKLTALHGEVWSGSVTLPGATNVIQLGSPVAAADLSALCKVQIGRHTYAIAQASPAGAASYTSLELDHAAPEAAAGAATAIIYTRPWVVRHVGSVAVESPGLADVGMPVATTPGVGRVVTLSTTPTAVVRAGHYVAPYNVFVEKVDTGDVLTLATEISLSADLVISPGFPISCVPRTFADARRDTLALPDKVGEGDETRMRQVADGIATALAALRKPTSPAFEQVVAEATSAKDTQFLFKLGAGDLSGLFSEQPPAAAELLFEQQAQVDGDDERPLLASPGGTSDGGGADVVEQLLQAMEITQMGFAATASGLAEVQTMLANLGVQDDRLDRAAAAMGNVNEWAQLLLQQGQEITLVADDLASSIGQLSDD